MVIASLWESVAIDSILEEAMLVVIEIHIS